MKQTRLHRIIAALLLLVFLGVPVSAENDGEAVRFTSIPDIFNWNISNPQPGWEESMDWLFTNLKKDGPDFSKIESKGGDDLIIY